MSLIKGNDWTVNIERVREHLRVAQNHLDQAMMQLSIFEHDQQEREHAAYQEAHDDGSERGRVSDTG